jgi:integrase
VSKGGSDKEYPRVSHQRLHLTPDEANRLIECAAKRGRQRFRDKVMVRMAYRHGMRASEVCTLRWDAINLDEGTLYVRRRKMGKDSSHSMDRDELSALRKLHKDRTGPWVFESERGGPCSVDTLARVIKEAAVLAKVPENLAHPHALRHAAGYFLVNSGQHDIRLVQDFLGHKTPAMTMHYTAVSPARLAAVRVR